MSAANRTNWQQTARTYGIFTDPFGREWGAIVDNSGVDRGQPVAPLIPRGWTPPKDEHGAPILPPDPFIRVSDVHARKIEFLFNDWRRSREAAIRDWNIRLRTTAREMYKGGALQAIQRKDAELWQLMGPEPPSVAQIDAYEQGHPWVLGKDPRKPDSLREIFPDPIDVESPQFLTWEEEQAQKAGGTGAGMVWPRKLPPQDGGGYITADGEEFTGSGAKTRAEAHQASLTGVS